MTAGGATAPRPGRTSGPRGVHVRLLERSQALDAFPQLRADASAGSGRLLLTTGAMATGKSALLRALRELAGQAGLVVVEATASSAEQDLPLAVFAQLIHGAPLSAVDRVRATDLLAAGGEDVRAVPSLCQLLLDLTSRQPLVLIVDDLQYADPASLTCLGYLSRRVQTARLLLALAELEPGRCAEDLVGADVLRRPHCRTVRVGPLSACGVAALARDLVGAAVAD